MKEINVEQVLAELTLAGLIEWTDKPDKEETFHLTPRGQQRAMEILQGLQPSDQILVVMHRRDLTDGLNI